MFYQTGVDITNDKQMFNFLKNHFEYYTMNSWNRLSSIANNVKLYNLNLSGDWGVAYDLLASGEYETINWTVYEWCREHPGYEVQFNGRSGGYLVLMNKDNSCSVLSEEITECVDYEEYKRWCREHVGSVRDNRPYLAQQVKLVQDFDRLCDTLRSYCDELSQQTFEIIEMRKAVDDFNEEYGNDLEYLEFDYLRCDDYGIVDLTEITRLSCLTEAFYRTADRSDCGYSLEWADDNRIHLFKMRA